MNTKEYQISLQKVISQFLKNQPTQTIAGKKYVTSGKILWQSIAKQQSLFYIQRPFVHATNYKLYFAYSIYSYVGQMVRPEKLFCSQATTLQPLVCRAEILPKGIKFILSNQIINESLKVYFTIYQPKQE